MIRSNSDSIPTRYPPRSYSPHVTATQRRPDWSTGLSGARLGPFPSGCFAIDDGLSSADTECLPASAKVPPSPYRCSHGSRRSSLSSRRHLCLQLLPGGRTSETVRCREHATRQSDRCTRGSPWVNSVDKYRWRSDETDTLGFFLGVDNPTMHGHVLVRVRKPIEQLVSDTPVRAAVEVEQRELHAHHRRSHPAGRPRHRPQTRTPAAGALAR